MLEGMFECVCVCVCGRGQRGGEGHSQFFTGSVRGTRGAQIPRVMSPWYLNYLQWLLLCACGVLISGLASFRPSSARIFFFFEMAARFLGEFVHLVEAHDVTV
jgi:hypothetical protein